MLCENGKVYTFGNNQFGQLGIGREFKSAQDESFTNPNNPLMNISSENTYITQPRFVFGITTPVKEIACGWYHTLAVTDTNEVYSWGRGDRGQLGIGRTKRAQVLPTKVDFFADNKRMISISKISGGKTHSCFVSTKGRIFV